MVVRMIWDISPDLFFISFEITPNISKGDFKTDKNKKDDISQISWTAMWFLINHIFTHKHRTIHDVKPAWWLQKSGMITMLTLWRDSFLFFRYIRWKVRLYQQIMKTKVRIDQTNAWSIFVAALPSFILMAYLFHISF